MIIPVRYDGADLDDVARLLDISVEEVVARHTGRVWRCRFIGFTAGFGYLASPGCGPVGAAAPAIANLGAPGSVALADGYSAVYPRRAPGGWQLIGSTEVPMWDLDRPRPALLSPGTRVRFVAAGPLMTTAVLAGRGARTERHDPRSRAARLVLCRCRRLRGRRHRLAAVGESFGRQHRRRGGDRVCPRRAAPAGPGAGDPRGDGRTRPDHRRRDTGRALLGSAPASR